MRILPTIVCIAGVIVGLSDCRKAESFPDDQYDPRLSGGAQTVFDRTSKAYGHAFADLSSYDAFVHDVGDAHFGQTFVTAPAPVNSGLGPIYNNVSCISCHHNDGIGFPTAGEAQSGLLLRLSIPGMDEHGGPLPIPGFGGQLQDKAVHGRLPEGTVQITYSTQLFTFPDGETCELRTPSYTILNPYLPLPSHFMLSPRLAPPVFGLGLLEAVPEAEILRHADPNDADGNGISGRPNYVWDPATHTRLIGRFGLKANTASLLTQVAGAYHQDMGITSRIFPTENAHGQSQADALADDPEVSDSILNAVKFYVQSLSVPARINVSLPQIQQGERLFKDAGCAGCHVPDLQTRVDVAFRSVSNQRIHPYSDLLLHDLGPALADNRPDFEADGQEWRTAPLWGIGLRDIVNPPAVYLHDGRARSLPEAILWHGGEAASSVDRYRSMSKADRNALIAFLKSL